MEKNGMDSEDIEKIESAGLGDELGVNREGQEEK